MCKSGVVISPVPTSCLARWGKSWIEIHMRPNAIRIDKVDGSYLKTYMINIYIQQVATILIKHLTELVNQIALFWNFHRKDVLSFVKQSALLWNCKIKALAGCEITPSWSSKIHLWQLHLVHKNIDNLNRQPQSMCYNLPYYLLNKLHWLNWGTTSINILDN